jgi:hypothetical protein
MTSQSWDKRPVWEQMGIKKFKRDSEIVWQWQNLEISTDCYECDAATYYHLRNVKEGHSIRIHDFAEMAAFIKFVGEHGMHMPFEPIPTENQLKIKEAQARLELVNQRRHEIEAEIERLKDGYSDDD